MRDGCNEFQDLSIDPRVSHGISFMVNFYLHFILKIKIRCCFPHLNLYLCIICPLLHYFPISRVLLSSLKLLIFLLL
jgi:hypothetical protein